MSGLIFETLTRDECDRLAIAIFEPDDDCAHDLVPLYAEVARLVAAGRDDERERIITTAQVERDALAAQVAAVEEIAASWACDDPGCDREGGAYIRSALANPQAAR